MNIPRTTGWGLALAGGTALISGVSIFLNGWMVNKEFSDPIALTGARNALVGLMLAGVLVATTRRNGSEERSRQPLGRRRWLALLGVAAIGGSIPFMLFFSGLAEATGPGAALIHKTMFVWVAALAIPFLGERLGAAQVVAMIALLAGTLLVGPSAAPGFATAELLVFAATILWSIEVVLVKRLLGAGLPVVQLATARMALGSLIILGFLAVSGRSEAIIAFSAYQWALIGITAVLLLGYVTTWYAALQRAPATLVTSVLVGGAIVTALLSSVRAGGLPAAPVAAGLVLVALGVGMAVWITFRRSAGVGVAGQA